MEEDFYILVPLHKAEDMWFDNEDDDILEIKDISKNLQIGKYKEISYERLYEFIYEKVKNEIASEFNI